MALDGMRERRSFVQEKTTGIQIESRRRPSHYLDLGAAQGLGLDADLWEVGKHVGDGPSCDDGQSNDSESE